MKIKQLSVFLEDRSGRLTEMTQILAEHEINITALSVAETTDYGIVRIVVGKPDVAQEFLADAGFSVSLTEVVCVGMPDKAGSLHYILEILADNSVNVDYMYAFSNKDVALAVIRAEDIDRVIDILEKQNVKLLQQKDIYQL